jgi:hypothetical protein
MCTEVSTLVFKRHEKEQNSKKSLNSSQTSTRKKVTNTSRETKSQRKKTENTMKTTEMQQKPRY